MEEKIKNLEEQIEFLKEIIKFYCIPQLDESLFSDWKNKRGIFGSKKI